MERQVPSRLRNGYKLSHNRAYLLCGLHICLKDNRSYAPHANNRGMAPILELRAQDYIAPNIRKPSIRYCLYMKTYLCLGSGWLGKTRQPIEEVSPYEAYRAPSRWSDRLSVLSYW